MILSLAMFDTIVKIKKISVEYISSCCLSPDLCFDPHISPLAVNLAIFFTGMGLYHDTQFL